MATLPVSQLQVAQMCLVTQQPFTATLMATLTAPQLQVAQMCLVTQRLNNAVQIATAPFGLGSYSDQQNLKNT